ncbi:MAG: ZIP family metal transporter [Bacilli bacterium]|nr:ZIP family metal transporter [Bacilli bacterium]
MPQILLCLIIPFIGTTLGAACVFFLKDKINPKLEKTLLGFAGGVMMAASIWSLIIPSIDTSKEQYGKLSWLPALIGFAIGIIFLLIIDSIVPHLHARSNKPEGIKSKLSKSTTLVLAVTIHNIPEGLTVGVMIAGAMANNAQISIMSALVLAIGIAIQNFPEGAIISLPLKAEGNSKFKSFLYGMVSAAAELISAVIALFITSFITPILPYILSFAAGAMIYVVVEELIPEAKEGEHTNLSTIGFAIGFALMMVLDIALG